VFNFKSSPDDCSILKIDITIAYSVPAAGKHDSWKVGDTGVMIAGRTFHPANGARSFLGRPRQLKIDAFITPSHAQPLGIKNK
jgi:hypothetical protein